MVTQSRSGRTLKQPIKCYACGGFLPWENWGRFWQSNMNVGNGGVLQRPASDYDELNEVRVACGIKFTVCPPRSLISRKAPSCIPRLAHGSWSRTNQMLQKMRSNIVLDCRPAVCVSVTRYSYFITTVCSMLDMQLLPVVMQSCRVLPSPAGQSSCLFLSSVMVDVLYVAKIFFNFTEA